MVGERNLTEELKSLTVEELQKLALEELLELKKKVEKAVEEKAWYVAKGIYDKRSISRLYKEFLECDNLYAVYESDNSADAKYETEEYLELKGVKDFRKWLKGFKLDKERIKEVVEEVAEEMRKAEVGLETDRVYVCTLWDGTDVYVKVGL